MPAWSMTHVLFLENDIICLRQWCFLAGWCQCGLLISRCKCCVLIGCVTYTGRGLYSNGCSDWLAWSCDFFQRSNWWLVAHAQWAWKLYKTRAGVWLYHSTPKRLSQICNYTLSSYFWERWRGSVRGRMLIKTVGNYRSLTGKWSTELEE